MTEQETRCELCNLPVKVTGFTLGAADAKLFFCCEGCLSVYRMLNFEQFENTNNNTSNEKS
jgi:hypothetical protein